MLVYFFGFFRLQYLREGKVACQSEGISFVNAKKEVGKRQERPLFLFLPLFPPLLPSKDDWRKKGGQVPAMSGAARNTQHYIKNTAI